ncbi:UNVERIFIED_CONTAM: hypothetical protein K2H54_034994 [Gekko kuhli]
MSLLQFMVATCLLFRLPYCVQPTSRGKICVSLSLQPQSLLFDFLIFQNTQHWNVYLLPSHLPSPHSPPSPASPPLAVATNSCCRLDAALNVKKNCLKKLYKEEKK